MEAKRRMGKEKFLLIDVRERDEYAAERISGAAHHPLSSLDPIVVGAAAEGHSAILVYCRSGRRGADAARKLEAAGLSPILQIQGGIEGWKAAGLSVKHGGFRMGGSSSGAKGSGAGAAAKPARAPIGVLRQTQITIGTLTLLGVVLGITVSDWALALPAAMGGGLVVAGLTGTCGLAVLLEKMPWNRGKPAASCPIGADSSSQTGLPGVTSHTPAHTPGHTPPDPAVTARPPQ